MDILDKINNLTEFEICDVVDAVLRRYHDLFPDWEIATISICKNLDRTEQINNIIQLLEKLKTSR